ncbi:unnamed protein product [Effrenium voratum]|nr:unnamed protein product [Effrenium voratum]
MEAKKQLNVLVYFVGTRGDVMPGVAVCQALEARGHKAAMAVCAGVEESIRAYGVRCITVSQVPFKWRDDTAHMSEEEVQIIRRSMDSNEFLKVESRRGMSWNLDECLPATLQGICNLMEKEHFDVILGTAITGLACVRLLKKCPHLKIIRSTFSFGFSSPPTSAYPPGGYEMSNGFVNKLKHYHFLFFKLLPLLAGASYFKRELSRMLEIEGIDHSQGLGPFSTLAKLPELGFWSESLQARPPDFPEQFLVTGCLFVPHLKDWTPLPALERFMQLRDSQGRKPVVLSFGSMLGVQRVELAVLEAAQRMGLNVVWCHESAGKERVAYSFTANSKDAEAPVQDGVCEVKYAPFDWLLPQASVVVCHGGAGTVFRSLREGVPVVICPVITPILADQTAHAQFVERKELGAWLRPLWPSAVECQVALERALSCADACAELGARMRREDGAAGAAAAIEALALKPPEEAPSCFAWLGKWLGA